VGVKGLTFFSLLCCITRYNR